MTLLGQPQKSAFVNSSNTSILSKTKLFGTSLAEESSSSVVRHESRRKTSGKETRGRITSGRSSLRRSGGVRERKQKTRREKERRRRDINNKDRGNWPKRIVDTGLIAAARRARIEPAVTTVCPRDRSSEIRRRCAWTTFLAGNNLQNAVFILELFY